MRLPLPLLIDLVAVGVFAVVGRASHGEALTLTGILTVAWPFWAGCLLGWAATVPARRLTRYPEHWRDASRLTTGLVVWPATYVIGMVLRALTGQGTAWPFLLVALIALAVLLLGWRLLRLAVARAANAD